MARRYTGLSFSIFFCGVALLAITGGSFWIDEFWTWKCTAFPTLADNWRAMVQNRLPEIQAPFYMAYMWAYTKVLGTGEWGMRMAALPWFAAGAVVFTLSLRCDFAPRWAVALTLSTNAFVWYYLNEARLYAFQLGFALAVVGAGVRIVCASVPEKWMLRIFAAGLVGLCGSNVLGAMWGACFFGAMVLMLSFRRSFSLFASVPVTAGISAVALLLLAAYYGWTLTTHPRPTAVGTTNAQTVIFSIYELFGVGGLGPGRNELRAHGAHALKPFLAYVLVYGVVVGWLFLRGVLGVQRQVGARKFVIVALLIAAPALSLLLLGVTTHVRVLGRHWTCLAPVVIGFVSYGVLSEIRCSGFRRLIVGLFVISAIASCLSIRFAPRHHKDDYRSAAKVARDAALSGKVVWWNADPWGAEYYNLLPPPADSKIMSFQNPDMRMLQASPMADVVVASKPDTYDGGGAIQAYLREHAYVRVKQLPAFSIWSRKER